MNFYNENDPKAAAWLRELIYHGHIPAGVVDERSIEDIIPSELEMYTQCHFFAGIGGWSLALKLAGWPEDQAVWTGSCPCQPFSTAGKGTGFADERHLWPAFHHLISQCQPAIVFGEQVASKDGLGWLDLVCADCEAAGYAFGAVDLCAASVGSPHIRQRLYWVGRSQCQRSQGGDFPEDLSAGSGQQAGRIGGVGESDCSGRQQGVHGAKALGHRGSTEPAGGLLGLAHPGHQGLERHGGHGYEGNESGRFRADALGSVAEGGSVDGLDNSVSIRRQQGGYRDNAGNEWKQSAADVSDDGVADANGEDCGGRRVQGSRESIGASSWTALERSEGLCENRRPSPLHGFWRDADWLHCRDGKWRPVEPGTLPLAHGVPERVVRLRGYGNAIVPQVAAEFVKAYLGT